MVRCTGWVGIWQTTFFLTTPSHFSQAFPTIDRPSIYIPSQPQQISQDGPRCYRREEAEEEVVQGKGYVDMMLLLVPSSFGLGLGEH